MSFHRFRIPLLALLLGSGFGFPSNAAITGVCPDGSIFIVQKASAIPCREARRVDPSDVPPIQPEFLPRPYGWERFHQRSDPNNPYNVLESQQARVGNGAPPPSPKRAPQAQPAPALRPAPQAPRQVAAYAPQHRPAPISQGLDLGLELAERADLDEMVGLLQSVAPASVSRIGARGERRLTVQFARSSSFEQRMHHELVRRGLTSRGPVLLFRAEAQEAESFHGNLTFVQGHVAFHPDAANAEQFGVIHGRLGPLAAGQRVLGYAVLPEHLDLSEPLDIYWNDLRVTASLAGPTVR